MIWGLISSLKWYLKKSYYMWLYSQLWIQSAVQSQSLIKQSLIKNKKLTFP